ncbi:MAG: hypothetical protein A2857_07095 [Candidatus Levybacteria bacterium RIFCSPHIGHO2_01_FULL_36_15]|nr:MAG: hypothetical protein A2857_07095 [Candidatus Levybacteria bacterium RIFCSPHIGHO2_01_FULL_36_15]OGH38729.1 MAG: hypothetical protein A2905_01810 [Candidatus Levybacteria bacterium RIFCSPLOWO2_01_FULL_36_10]
MPRKIARKYRKIVKEKEFKQNLNSANLVNLDSTKSYTSLLYGALTVVLLLGFLIVGSKILSLNKNNKAVISNESAKTSVEKEKNTPNSVKTYTVKQGDSLWSISDEFYKTGYKWGEIARANKIASPENIEIGTKIVIPETAEIKTKILTEEVKNTNKAVVVENKIEGKEYTVKKGDSLWMIAVRAYGDGFKWVEIAKENNLINPGVIHAGNTFKIPRFANSS